MAAMSRAASPASYCADAVKAADSDRYLASLFAPPARRAHLLALYAFNVEVAKVAETVSQPIMGEMRLEWWRETVEAIHAGTPRSHPVAEALAEAVAEADLPLQPFLTLLDARRADVDLEPFGTDAALEAYCAATASGLMTLAAMSAAPSADREALAAAAEPAGKAWALTGLLRALPFQASRGRVSLSRETLERHGGSAAEIRLGRSTPALRNAMQEMAERARLHLAEARRLLAANREAPPAVFLPIALCPAYLDRIERPGFDPFRDSTEIALLRRQLTLLWRGLLGRN